ncbi:type IV toxin-antitoxin system AbiEi family antitoxin domain-containing protein [Acinetobacter gyllenbergii]|uniref:type IV toxin-antitoxin system AbiEi family antitoxin domain-containing protein n=1 Tax=Acinetobacter gyllenbergii TaxID=134534 RepID=UPI0021D26E08|nr:type IV toxin-antitoxin system AbiEi family antitoxin domain-containing protein [Acinetobacter gyllenbergii]MCU4582642.1 type IV toxin-antitoxin system AbiEi family antitoxin domain-containing protein [Acinetobacter gyllenbergii]
MKLEVRMRQSINRRSGVVVSRSDVAPLGSPTQVTHALNLLLEKGELVRLSHGVYAKAKKLADNNIKVEGSFELIIREAAEKLRLVLHQQDLDFTHENTSVDGIIIETETPRVKRKLVIHGKTVWFRSYHHKSPIKKNIFPLVKSPPTQGVAMYVLELARYHKVSYSYNMMDQWANAVTCLAGDEVKHDSIEDLLVALKRAGKISKKDVAVLAINYLRERKQNVRSV